MNVIHVYKSDHKYSSRIAAQLSIDRGTVKDFVFYLDIKLIYYILKNKNSVVIFHQHAMLLNLLVCFLLNKVLRTGHLMCFDCHDINEYHDDFKMVRKFAWFAFFILERITFTLNIPVMCVSRCFSKLLYKKYRKSVYFVPNVPLQDDESLIKEFKSRRDGEKLNLIYFGHVNQSRLPLDVIEKLSEDYNIDIYGKFAGHTKSYYDEIKDYENKNKNKVRFLGAYKPIEIGNILCKYDASLLVFEADKLNIRYCMPNKLYQSLSNSIPCIVSKGLNEISITFKNSSSVITLNDFLQKPDSLFFDVECIEIIRKNKKAFVDNYLTLLSQV